MSGFLIWVLTFAIILDCLLMVLLVLMQLPKKEAGAGLAFGGGATDALFGAGSGNFLTKATKYAAIAFFSLSLVLAILIRHHYMPESGFFNQVQQHQTGQPAGVPAAAPAPSAPAPAAPAPSTTPATQPGSGLQPLTGTNAAPK